MSRAIRVCRTANGRTPRLSQARISPSSTQPSGRRAAAWASSGKRPVTNSSPRDHRKTSPRRRISWARMPSHFHSASQRSMLPSRCGGCSSGEARKNGYGSEGSSWARAAASNPWYQVAVGCHLPARRWAMVARGIPETAPSARTTRGCDTPTRNVPVSSLLSTNSSPKGSCRHQAVTLAYCCSSASSRRGRMRSSSQRCSDRGSLSADVPRCTSSVTVSALSPVAACASPTNHSGSSV